MAIGIFELDDAEHGIGLALFGLPGEPALEGLDIFKPARSRRTSRAPSREPTPPPPPPAEVDYDACSSARSGDLCDEPARWFGDENSDELLSLTLSPPLSSSSLSSGSFLETLNADGEQDILALSSVSAHGEKPIADFMMRQGQLCGRDSPIQRQEAEQSSIATSKRGRDFEQAASRQVLDDEPPLKLARSGGSPRAELWAGNNDYVDVVYAFVPSMPVHRPAPVPVGEPPNSAYNMLPMCGVSQMYVAPQMHGAPYMQSMPISRSSSAETMPSLPMTPSSALSRTPSSAFSRTSSSASSSTPTRRGENVKGNPQMQKTARDGQKHWYEKAQELRARDLLAQATVTFPPFGDQRATCSVLKLKSQKESLLIYLQMATQQGLISPLPFVHSADETAGFLGWTGFYVQTGCGQRFRAGVEGLFPETPKLNTLYHLFRRAGLVPEDWRRAWNGEVPFSWNPNRAS